MRALKLHVPLSPKETGVVIENKQLDPNTHRFAIKLDDLSRVPNADDFYLISFRGVKGVRNEYHQLKVSGMPDENNLLAFTIQSSSNFSNKLAAVLPGTKVKIKGPINNAVKQAG